MLAPPEPAAEPAAPPAAAAPEPAFARGDLCWSKIWGFPWWPSQVRSVRGLRRRPADADDESWQPRARVRFLHTKDNAELPLDKLLPYTAENLELGVIKPKMFKSKTLEAKFRTSVELSKELAV